MRALLVALILFVGLAAQPARAVDPDEKLADPALEARAEALEKRLRCVVCQSQSLAESDAFLAKDLRNLLRERIKAGDTDKEAVDYLVQRYGQYVLLMPRFEPSTYALWILPGAAILIGGLVAFAHLKRQARAPAPAALDATDEEHLKQLLNERT
ncbi:MAG TPA: cytochrome c-type biogenesis protein [Parvularculaceae bacterium]|nr:cytochrome c-type biogenesis protein [Parvularculaceae bacterium]